MVAMAFLEAGLDPDETSAAAAACGSATGCSAAGTGAATARSTWPRRIYQSCDVYFYHFAQKIGMDPIAAMAAGWGWAGIRPAGRQPVPTARCPIRRGS
jgi:penicillin-binding protein 2